MLIKKLILASFLLLQSFTAHADGIDANTLFISHLDGADGATTATDSSSFARTITFAGTAQIDTAQAKFSQSLLLDGNSDYITIPDAADLDFVDFTFDGWYRFASITGNQTFICRDADVTQFMVRWNDSAFSVFVAGSEYNETWSPSADTWYHIAISRSGSSLRFFINGTQIGTTKTNGTGVSATSLMMIGARTTGASHYFNGWIDEPRISNTARYVADFTPPAAPYSAGGGGTDRFFTVLE